MNISPASAEDLNDIARIHAEGWRAAYGGLVRQEALDAQDQAQRSRDWKQWLEGGLVRAAVARAADGEAAGFVGYGRLRTPPPGSSPIRPLYSGEVYALYILPAYWRQGLGRRLMAEAASGLRTMKHKSLCLWVLEGNVRAVAFYKALGGQRCGVKTIDIGGTAVRECVFGWRDTAGLVPAVTPEG